jgi:hypothetical protein
MNFFCFSKPAEIDPEQYTAHVHYCNKATIFHLHSNLAGRKVSATVDAIFLQDGSDWFISSGETGLIIRQHRSRSSRCRQSLPLEAGAAMEQAGMFRQVRI